MPKSNPKQHPQKNTLPQEFMQPEFFTPKMSEAEEIKTLLSWQAPARPFRKKNRSYYTTIAIIVILVILILFLYNK